MPRSKPTALDSFNEIAAIRIALTGSDPMIWRAVEVPTSMTLTALNDVVQAVVGWCFLHLWAFRIDGHAYGPLMDADWGPRSPIDAAKTRLRDVLRGRKMTFNYTYDFGDCWEHTLAVTDIRQGEPGVGYPRYVGGEWNGPPEDCGGLPGFYALLEARDDPANPGHANAVEWLDDYDPRAIEQLPITYALLRIANRRNAAALRLARKAGRGNG